MSSESKIPCPTRGKIVTLAWYPSHLKIHDDKFRSKCCFMCEYKSLRSSDLKRHSMSHRKMLDVHRVQVPLCKKYDHRHNRQSECTFLCGFCSTRFTDIRFVLLHQLTTSCNDERVTHQEAALLAPDATGNETMDIDSVDAETFASEHPQTNNSFKSPKERLSPLKDTSENTFTPHFCLEYGLNLKTDAICNQHMPCSDLD